MPDTNLIVPGLSPDQEELQCIDRGLYYSEVIQFVNFDTLQLPAPFGLRVVDSIIIMRINNLPCGISWQTDRANRTYKAAENGCISLFGTSLDSTGQYALDIRADAWLRNPNNGTVLTIKDGALSAFGLDYALRVKNVQDTCWTLDTLFINYPPKTACSGYDPILSMDVDENQAVCDDGALQIDMNVYGGNGLLQYEWTPTTGLSCWTCEDPIITVNTPTTYTVVATDFNGKTGTAIVNVDVSSITVDLGMDTNLTCGQFFVDLVPQLSGDVITPITYNWSNGSMDSVVNVPDGNYTVTVTNGFGCNGTDDVTVTVDSALSFDAGEDSSFCDTGTYTVVLDPTILTDGSGNYTYSWTPTAGLSDPTIINPTATITGGITYTLVIDDQNNGCSFTDSVTFYMSYLEVDAGSDVSISSGQGDTLMGSIVVDMGSGDYDYSWAPTLGLDDHTVMNPVASPTQSTTYTLTVEDEESGCTYTDTVRVTVLVGIDETDISSAISIYPNPAKSEFVVQISEQINTNSIRLFDIAGNLVKDIQVTSFGLVNVDASDLSSGVYFIEVEGDNGVGRKRVVIAE